MTLRLNLTVASYVGGRTFDAQHRDLQCGLRFCDFFQSFQGEFGDSIYRITFIKSLTLDIRKVGAGKLTSQESKF